MADSSARPGFLIIFDCGLPGRAASWWYLFRSGRPLDLRRHDEPLTVFARKIAIGLEVASERLGLWIELEDAAGPVAHIRQVAQGGREVPFFDVGREIGMPAAPHRSQEVCDQRRGLPRARLGVVHLLGQFPFFPAVDLEPAQVDRHRPFSAEKEITDEVTAVEGDRALASGEQTADLENELAVSVVERRQLSIRRLLIVVVAELPAARVDAPRKRRFPEPPARDIHFVDPLVADIAVTRIPEPVPVVVEPV